MDLFRHPTVRTVIATHALGASLASKATEQQRKGEAYKSCVRGLQTCTVVRSTHNPQQPPISGNNLGQG
eukprot:scaffold148481_cov17-Tisochrysis_lutea.AAC.1